MELLFKERNLRFGIKLMLITKHLILIELGVNIIVETFEY